MSEWHMIDKETIEKVRDEYNPDKEFHEHPEVNKIMQAAVQDVYGLSDEELCKLVLGWKD